MNIFIALELRTSDIIHLSVNFSAKTFPVVISLRFKTSTTDSSSLRDAHSRFLQRPIPLEIIMIRQSALWFRVSVLHGVLESFKDGVVVVRLGIHRA